MLEARLGSLWGISGGLLEVFENSLGGFWEVSGRLLGRLRDFLSGIPPGGFWEVLDSKSDAHLSENEKILPKLVTLPCVFEGHNHCML